MNSLKEAVPILIEKLANPLRDQVMCVYRLSSTRPIYQLDFHQQKDNYELVIRNGERHEMYRFNIDKVTHESDYVNSIKDTVNYELLDFILSGFVIIENQFKDAPNEA